ncbi:uncharacterized protein LOC119672902 [Teleopsis dalmanni]|uniref:uncharacterized protein LOC119672902 n=1 Tax=Teleopsis dalmanni TaxID=139649 RepID=UPI0018CDCDB2|nr:uncharacterized protein LOC119672902 [Teleopsis dalmanni]
MLDIMKETLSTATMLPVSLATTDNVSKKCEEIKQNSNTQINLSPNKTKTIFSWLKNATSPTTKTHCDNIETIPENKNIVTVDCTCKIVTERIDKVARAKSPDAALREFRGVQSLRHLWNKRISSANTENARSKSNNNKANKLTKSISCLVNAANSIDAPDKSEELTKRRSWLSKRTQSLHDCTQLPYEDETREPLENKIDFLHREKDNFYKYKTAEQASKHLVRSAPKTKRVSAGIVTSTTTNDDAHFPAIKSSEKGEHIHWLKRQDIIIKRRCSIEGKVNESTCQTLRSKNNDENMAINDKTVKNKASSSLSNDNNVLISCGGNVSTKQTLASADSQSELSVSSDTAETLTAANSPKNVASQKRNAVRETLSTPSSSSSKRGSTDSLGSSSTTIRSARRTNSSAARKCSFKTNTRSFHSLRKMNSNKDSASASTGTGTTAFSMVAKLTQQFNEIIQKDKKILEEVKRKNGVLMSRGGHVYKVIEKTEFDKTNAHANSLSRNGSRAKDASTVQRNIKKFENGVATVGEKPKVPAKSLQVLRKRNEMAVQRNHKTGLGTANVKRASLTLNPAQTQLESQSKLAVVTEETKTPLENEEKLMPTDSRVSPDKSGVLLRVQETASVNTKTNLSEKKENITKPTTAVNAVTTSVTNKVVPDVDKNVDAATCELIAVAKELSKVHATGVVTQAQLQPIETQVSKINEINSPTKETEPKTAISSQAASNENLAASGDDLDGLYDEKSKQRKHKYANIYEKFRFRSPFRGQNKKTTPNSSPEKLQECNSEEIPNLQSEPAAKILDALEVIDRKLKDLTVEVEPTNIVLNMNDDFEQRVLPNSSFIYQLNNKQVANNELLVTQAVNVALVNSIEGEQMIMEQKELQNTMLIKQQQGESTEVVVEKASTSDTLEEDMYEPIAEADAITETKTEALSPQPSSLYKLCTANKITEVVNPTNQIVECVEDIYQTVEEALLIDNKTAITAITAPAAVITTTTMKVSVDILNDYESIAGSREQTTNIIETLLDDDYEICEPPPDEPVVTQLTTQLSTGTLMRNTNDELPELPKPKRRLPKSPMPGKRPPKPTAHLTTNLHCSNPETNTQALPAKQFSDTLLHQDDDDEHHYYADDENIYDTIKGSHCYESLHSEILKYQHKTKQNSIDSVSLISNGYESITQYRRAVVHNGSPSSGSGSTLTLSSDHKTNSLYESTMTTSMLYGVGSMGCGARLSSGSSNAGGSAGATSAGTSSACNSYTRSNTACSDNSDELNWIDISDAEAEDEQRNITKQQFVVVRERLKVHRSPDWSKRVRDKRLQQKKAMSCIEDKSKTKFFK